MLLLCAIQKNQVKTDLFSFNFTLIVKVMTILSQAEFNQRSSSGKHSLEKIYQGKCLEGGPVFSLGNLQAAELYCERFSHRQTGGTCIIVKETSFVRIWSEISQAEVLQAEENTNPKGLSLEAKVATSINSLPVTVEFTDFCQKLLAEYIGPIAKMICKKTLAKKSHLSRTEFVAILAKKISDPKQAQEFQQAALD